MQKNLSKLLKGYFSFQRYVQLLSYFKDFGKGFYLTSSREQARSFINASSKKAIVQGVVTEQQKYGVISTFCYHHNESIRNFIFSNADAEWVHCVVGHRKVNIFPSVVEEMKKYDIIAGKIADDATNVTIMTYLVGAYGNIGSEQADNFCISRLLPERLKDRFCFRTDKL